MRTAKAIIGAGYGDEGKGLVTDLAASMTADSVVVRSNGGAQAGHTVVVPDGRRHVFHHVGSGALAGAPTHLSAFFVAHPMLLLAERKALADLGAATAISSDPRAIVTVPFDMMINQALELSRGYARHGSCGLGFGEAIERNLHSEFSILTGDLFGGDLTERLRRIWSEWMPVRLRRLGLVALPDEIRRHIDVEGVIARFVADCEDYLDSVTLWPDRRLLEKGQVIFEGAQGLLLDQHYGTFPHVTRSNTGLANMLSIAMEAGIEEIKACYVTRCYATRHGAGPLAHEASSMPGIAVADPTNAPNPWQGTMRIAPLDLDVLRAAVMHDMKRARSSSVSVEASVAVTCLDQAVGALTLRSEGGSTDAVADSAAETIARHVGLRLSGESWGAGRSFFRPGRALAAA